MARKRRKPVQPNQANQPGQPDQPDRVGREAIDKIGKFADTAIWVVTGLIALVFVGVSIKDIPFGQAITNADPQHLQDLLLSVYMLCWALGTKQDASVQKSVYVHDPHGGRVRAGSLLAVAAIAAIAVTLLLVRRNDLYFAMALSVFTAVDIATWLYLRYKFLPPIIAATRDKYDHGRDYFGLVKLKYVEQLITGNWKWYREAFLVVIVLLMIFNAAFSSVSSALALVAQKLLAGLSFAVDAGKLASLAPDVLLLLFVAVSEGWMWFYRLRTYWTVGIVSDLEKNYQIAPKEAAQVAAAQAASD
jgi:hypothetical protein